MSGKDLRTRSGTPIRGSLDSGRRLGLDVGDSLQEEMGCLGGEPSIRLGHGVTEMVGEP